MYKEGRSIQFCEFRNVLHISFITSWLTLISLNFPSFSWNIQISGDSSWSHTMTTIHWILHNHRGDALLCNKVLSYIWAGRLSRFTAANVTPPVWQYALLTSTNFNPYRNYSQAVTSWNGHFCVRCLVTLPLAAFKQLLLCAFTIEIYDVSLLEKYLHVLCLFRVTFFSPLCWCWMHSLYFTRQRGQFHCG